MKRRRNSQIIKYNKLSITQFEDLSNELLYEIFDYFDYCFLYEIFLKLNSRFYSLIINSSLIIKINLPLTSKILFENRCKSIVTSNLNRIISLNISKYFLDYFSLNSFPFLQYLVIHDISSEKIPLLIHQLTSLSNFYSLSISSSNYFQDENSIYLSIFYLLKLKFCKLTFPSSGERVPIPFSTNHYSTLEHLILNGHCRLDQLISILSYTPKLRHLFCQHLYGSGCTEKELPLNLSSISLILYQISFEDLKLFLSKISIHLKRLRIKISNDENYFHAEEWEELISNSIPDLNIFDFQYSILINDNNNRKNLIEKFHSNFWIKRKWIFGYYYSKNENSYYLNFFSRISKFHHFILYEQLDDNEYQSNTNNHINFARHLTIEGQLKSAIQFPYVTKLTLKEIPLFINEMSSMICLKQITNLDIKDKQLSMNDLIHILQPMPNVQSLTLSSVLPFESKRNRTTNILSKMNRITKLIIDDDECEIKHIHFLVYLFPYLEYLEIGLNETNLSEILQYLIMKLKYLFSLFLLNVNCKIIEKVDLLIKDYKIERIHGGLYLWW